MIKKTNLFISETEYHFLMSITLIEEHFKEGYSNILILSSYRSSAIDRNSLPSYIQVLSIDFSKSKNDIFKVLEVLEKLTIREVFLFHLYRPLEAYLVYKLNKARINLVEDGSMYYHIREKSGLPSRIRTVISIYMELFKMRLYLLKILVYRYYIWHSSDIDMLWMTRPEMFIDREKNQKPIKKLSLFKNKNLVNQFEGYFSVQIPRFKDALFYISFKVYSKKDAQIERKIIEYIFSKSNKKQLHIKLHPAARPYQVRELTENFPNVFFNNIPAELYIGNAKSTSIYGVASTSMFYHNEDCQYYSLMEVAKHLGLYAKWKNIQLPEYVDVIKNFQPFEEFGI